MVPNLFQSEDILHVTRHPGRKWIYQLLVLHFHSSHPYFYVIRDQNCSYYLISKVFMFEFTRTMGMAFFPSADVDWTCFGICVCSFTIAHIVCPLSLVCVVIWIGILALSMFFVFEPLTFINWPVRIVKCARSMFLVGLVKADKSSVVWLKFKVH